MRTLFIDDEPEASDAVAEPTMPDLKRRYRIYLFVGVNFVAYGLLLQWLMPTTTLQCERPASGTASCVLSERILLGLVTTETTEPAGLRGARMVPKATRRSPWLDRYHVELQMAAGHEYTMASSSSFDAADRLARTIDERLRAASAFEASLGFSVQDWERALWLIAIAGGAGMAVVGQVGYRRSRATQP